jgi:hypothetical protein
VSEYDREAWIMRRPWATRECCDMEKRKKEKIFFSVVNLAG